MLFRDMLGEPSHEIKNRNCFGDEFFVFMTIVMKSNKFAIIRVNAGSCNDWPAKVTANVFNHLRRIAFIGHSPDIEPIFVVRIDGGFYFFKGIT